MVDVRDYELLKSQDEPARPSPLAGPSRVWILVAALIAVAAAIVYIVAGRARREVPVTTLARPAAAAAPRPLGAEAPAIALPPLDETDPLIRDLVRQVTSHPKIAAWLTTNGLIRSFTVGVQNIAEGSTPAARFTVLRPPGPFETIGSGTVRIAPRSYQRYDDLAAAAASIDAAGAARLYTAVKPRIEEAYRDLGFPEAPFDRALERAIVSLLQAPAVDGAVRNDGTGIGYSYADPGLEGLTPAQKQLLRTGPANVRTIQASLRKIALALGIPADRLPPPRP
jgi:DUF3014 family protein